MFTCCFANYISERMIFEGALYLTDLGRDV